jgi:hypothetical protein
MVKPLLEEKAVLRNIPFSAKRNPPQMETAWGGFLWEDGNGLEADAEGYFVAEPCGLS